MCCSTCSSTESLRVRRGVPQNLEVCSPLPCRRLVASCSGCVCLLRHRRSRALVHFSSLVGVAWAFEQNEDESDRGKWLDVGLVHLLKNSSAETARRISAQLAHLQSGDTEVLCPQFELTLKRFTQTPGKTPRGSSRVSSDTPAPRQPSFGGGGSRASRASARSVRGKYEEDDEEGSEEDGDEEEQEEQEEQQGEEEEEAAEARRLTVSHTPHNPHAPHALHAPHARRALHALHAPRAPRATPAPRAPQGVDAGPAKSDEDANDDESEEELPWDGEGGRTCPTVAPLARLPDWARACCARCRRER